MGAVRGFVAAMEAWEDESARSFEDVLSERTPDEEWESARLAAGRRIFEEFTTSEFEERGLHFRQPSAYGELEFGKCMVDGDSARIEVRQSGILDLDLVFVLRLTDSGWRVRQRLVRHTDGSTTVVF